MVKLENIGIILAPTYRSRAYAQLLTLNNIHPELVITLPGDEPHWDGESKIHLHLKPKQNEIDYEPGISAVQNFSNQNIDIINSTTSDINSKEFIKLLKFIKPKILIYSGFGGVILKEDLLNCGKNFLHIHGGFAPQYRGSTTFYYSILKENKMGATAMWLVRNLDEGPILKRKIYDVPKGIDIDRVFDPVIRADLLCEVLSEYKEKGELESGYKAFEKPEMYYIVHPVIKHLALKKCGLLIN